MTLTFNWAEVQVDNLMQQNPDGYRDDDKMIAKMNEETWEVEDALALYLQSPIPENLIALKTEIGDQLFAIVCFANKKNISLEECFNLMMEKNRKRFKDGYKKEIDIIT